MPLENRVSVVLPPELLAGVTAKLNEIKADLQPFLIALTPEQRGTLAKMSDKTVAFVQKTLVYAQNSPQFAPSYLNVPELLIDIKAVEDLNTICGPVEQLCSSVTDTMMLSGSEAYVAALTYYNAVKLAAKNGVTDAEPIYNDLKKRFTLPSRPTSEEL